MGKIFLVLVLGLLSTEGLGMGLRRIRQSDTANNDDLEDRYGWNQYPNQGRFPNPEMFWPGQFPNQGQWQYPDPMFVPDQGNFPGLWQNPGQVNPNLRPNINLIPNPNQGQGQTTAPAPTGNGNRVTTDPPNLDVCLQGCPVTSEYNPVCGTNSVTYDNPGRLLCAQACGVSVTQLRTSRCPATTTAAPAS